MQAAFVHPGCLSTQADLNRMAAKVAAIQQPWKGSWDLLAANYHAQLSYNPSPQTEICAGGVCTPENYMKMAHDCAAAYQTALRYHISGDTRYADKAVQIMNAWASTFTRFTGDSNAGLRAGLYGYQFACAGELMRSYSGWAPADFAAFKSMLLNIFYPINSDFLVRHNGTCDSHYWANWDLAAMTSILAIGVLCDDQAKFDEAVTYFLEGIGNGAIGNAVHYLHPNGLGQWQESGRDQGHATLGMVLMGPFCEIAWNQGVDLYGYAGDLFLAGTEYVSKYNLFHDVPYVTYIQCDYWVNPVVACCPGHYRVGWDMIYNHYVNRMGLAAPYTAQYAEVVRPEGGGEGSTSGGYDSLGFTTLTHYRDPIASGAIPGSLRPFVKGGQVTLSWRGSAYAESYNVKRATSSGGPYTTLATAGDKNLYYVDAGLVPGTTYYYVVSANNPGGESADSAEASAVPDTQLYGTLIGTEGSWRNYGATKNTVFDGSLKNFFDSPDNYGWAGLDLGTGVSAVITQVAYCPRPGSNNHMAGGKFQGSDIADFSSGVVDLFTITAEPPQGVLTMQTISNPSAIRYVRYISPQGGFGNVAEVQFFGNVGGLNVPTAPVSLRATVADGFNINVSWAPVPNATSYTIRRSASPDEPSVVVENQEGTSFTDKGFSADTTCYYVVTALNSVGESVAFAEVSATTQTAGPTQAAHYAMDGDLSDRTSHHYHATGSGAPIYATGYSGQAIVLNGTSDYVRLPAGIANSDDITVASWVYWNGGGNWQRIFDFGNDTSHYMFLTPQSGSGTLRFAIKNGGSEQILETSTLPLGQWVHVAVTLGGNTAKLYVNGTARASNTTVTINPSDFNQDSNYIGKSHFSDPLFNGAIDEFRIYSYALSAADVGVLAGTAPADSTAPAAPTTFSATTDDGYMALTWADSPEIDLASYTLYRATTSGGPCSAIASGLKTSAYIDITVTGGTTYYYIVTATDLSSNESAASAVVSATPQTRSPKAPADLVITVGDGCVILDWADNSEIDLAGYTVYRSVAKGGPYSVVASGLTSSTLTDASVVNLRTYYYVVTATDTGSDESSHSRELSATPFGSGPIAWWRFENGANGNGIPGTTGKTVYQTGVADSSGHGNHLCDYWNSGEASSITYSSNIPPLSGLQNTLSGLSSSTSPSMSTWTYEAPPRGIDLEFAVLKAWTIEAFIYPTAITGSNRGIVGRDGRRAGTDKASPLYFNIQANGKLRCTYYDRAANIHDAQSTSTLSPNRWYYVAVTCDGTSLKLWLADLTAGATSATQVASVDVSGSSNPDFGPWFDGGTRGSWSVFRQYWSSNEVDRFQGNIDEVRISNVALDVNTEGLLLVGTTAPSFTVNPIHNIDAIEGTDYTGGSLATYAQDPDGIETVTFSKDAGPGWLLVAEDGTLSGIPKNSHVGDNTFTVRVTDRGGFSDTATMKIQVFNIYSGVLSPDDLMGLAGQWLSQNCTDVPACGGADLDGDTNVTITDFAILARNWLADEI
jgi:fibronectin type 3 domain-containing protein